MPATIAASAYVPLAEAIGIDVGLSRLCWILFVVPLRGARKVPVGARWPSPGRVPSSRTRPQGVFQAVARQWSDPRRLATS